MLQHLFSLFNEYFTLYIVFPFILVLGGYFTWRLRFVQLTKLKMSFSYLFKKQEKGDEGDISHYQAVASVLAGSFGTGNISGMAIALSTGGPGALVWMWIMAFFGSAIQYANCLLGVKYRTKNEDGEFAGGPMYYLRDGLKLKGLAMLFSICLIFGAFAAGNFAQVNSIALPLHALGIPPLVAGISLALLVGVVILGGIQRMAGVCSAVVPVMALFYLGTAVFILLLHADQILPALTTMLHAAFGGLSILGGTIGFTVMKALTTGFDRGIFATDAGTGIVPILQSSARTKHPVVDGVVALVSPFLVMLVCTMTALVLIITGAFSQSSLQSTNMVAHAFEAGLGKSIGSSIVIISLILFGYTTTIAWATCLQRAVRFLFGKALIRPFLFLYILMIPVGALLRVDFVWILADISLSCMLVINLVGVMGLANEVIGDSKEYFTSKQIESAQ